MGSVKYLTHQEYGKIQNEITRLRKKQSILDRNHDHYAKEIARYREVLEATLPILDRAAIGRLVVRRAHERANEIRKVLSKEVTQC